ncbi:hypothetical protein C8F01DRAFT_1224555 [Mycena amicta]|nr:hypothetical protein C8F01DRAFT_1224555 [Mycena amicta]
MFGAWPALGCRDGHGNLAAMTINAPRVGATRYESMSCLNSHDSVVAGLHTHMPAMEVRETTLGDGVQGNVYVADAAIQMQSRMFNGDYAQFSNERFSLSAILNTNFSQETYHASAVVAGRTLEQLGNQHGLMLPTGIGAGKCGRKRKISTEDLELAELELQDPDNDVANGEDLQRTMWEDIPGRTAMLTKYAHWIDKEIFKKGVVLNTDETKIFLSTSDGKHRCRQHRGQDIMNANLCIWGGIHPEGVTDLIRIEGNLDRFQYIEILKKAMLPLFDYTRAMACGPHSSFSKRTTTRNTRRNMPSLKQRICTHRCYAAAKTPDDLFAIAKDVWYLRKFIEYAKALKANNGMWIDY